MERQIILSIWGGAGPALRKLYSLQHCPYAMRARLGILLAQQSVLIRVVVTKNPLWLDSHEAFLLGKN